MRLIMTHSALMRLQPWWKNCIYREGRSPNSQLSSYKTSQPPKERNFLTKI
jgi:hypothetical protein